jgi:hypothetical protein
MLHAILCAFRVILRKPPRVILRKPPRVILRKPPRVILRLDRRTQKAEPPFRGSCGQAAG